MILFLLFFLFPYANEKRAARRPVMTRLLILLNTALFGAILVCGGYEEDSLFWDMAYEMEQWPI